MNTIKFSHNYNKMPADVSYTELLEVLITQKDELHGSFINYDTFHSKGYYELPTGKLIVLLLWSISYTERNMLWTTVRRWTSEKETYYRSLRGQQVIIEVQNET